MTPAALRQLVSEATPAPWSDAREELYGSIYVAADRRLIAKAPEMAALLADMAEALMQNAEYGVSNDLGDSALARLVSLGDTP